MVEQSILNNLKQVIEQGKDLLEWQDRLPHVFDVPVISEADVEHFKGLYKQWRSEYDTIIAQLEMRDVAMNIPRVDAEQEQRQMFLYVLDKDDQNRAIINALHKHIAELKKILEDIDYVEIDVREQIDGYKRVYGYDDKRACERLREDMLKLLKDNPRKRYVLDLRKMNMGDYDLLENLGQIMIAHESKERLWIEHRTIEDANIMKDYIHRVFAKNLVHIDTQIRELEPTYVFNIE